ncbi:hypothetical protein L6452_37614 [Arctium lappa]|uniref:Uncharacterized protein n=1 Tax=Arctium lappa TaxID=4217 RepID=A0ACB8Y465_ARCLA|nr:hypothetical protein L6452_37614 [Arctium lappa]
MEVVELLRRGAEQRWGWPNNRRRGVVELLRRGAEQRWGWPNNRRRGLVLKNPNTKGKQISSSPSKSPPLSKPSFVHHQSPPPSSIGSQFPKVDLPPFPSI